MTKPHFSSLRMDWRTPKAVYQVLDSEFQFDHDPCPAGWDGKIDGLSSDWGKSNYVNPPYGRELPKWIEKGHQEWQKGKFNTQPHRHTLVARLLHESNRNSLHKRQA